MKHLGDITKIKGNEVPIVDIICGGSPCQDLSVAGKRAGLDGERSGLFMEQIRIVKEMRNEYIRQLQLRRADVNIRDIRPRYMVWENVPGAFSSNKGEDFRCVLEEICRIADKTATVPMPEKGKWSTSGCIVGDGWSIAWRVHDAQFWGVPQRRKRISLVADFGGKSAPEILFERKGLSGDIEESGEKGQGIATDTERSVDKAIGRLNPWDVQSKSIFTEDSVCQSLCSGTTEGMNIQPCVLQNKTEPILLESNQNHATIQTSGISTTLSASMGMGGGYVPMITDKAISFQERAGKSGGGKGILIQNERIGALSTLNNQSVCYAVDQGGGKSQANVTENISPTLTTTHQGEPAVCIENHPADSRVKISEDGIVQTLSSRMGTGGGNVPMVMEQAISIGNGQLHDAMSPSVEVSKTLNCMDDPMKIMTYQNTVGALCAVDYKGAGRQYVNDNKCIVSQSVVRRLTPLECERLQGFPDNWTNIGEWIDTKGKKHKDADSPRYKALGNSIALPFWEWMAARMVKELNVEHPTMASLFDGIGGFPLVFNRCGCKPIWASEIEEFPIAVTKIRFPEKSEVTNDK